MANEESVIFLCKKYQLLMGDGYERDRTNGTKRSMCLWFHDPMAAKAYTITKTPSVAANEARNFLQMGLDYCDPITEYRENLSNSRLKTNWATYGRPVIANRRRSKSTGHSFRKKDRVNMGSGRAKSDVVDSKVDNYVVKSVSDDITSGSEETDFSEDSKISKFTGSDESSLYNLKGLDKIPLSNPTYCDSLLLSNNVIRTWHSNVTLYTMDVVNGVKMTMNQTYTSSDTNGINDNISSDTTNTTPSCHTLPSNTLPCHTIPTNNIPTPS